MRDTAIRVECDLRDSRESELDSSQIEQVIVNVVQNAIEAIGREGLLRLTLEHGTLTIADSGPGIARGVESEERDGRGLGLTITQEILTNHGFAFSLENRPEGGAEFRIVFG